ncbi:MAG: peptidoglycan-binding domain-containing protein [Solirubrobacterales bacterium]
MSVRPTTAVATRGRILALALTATLALCLAPVPGAGAATGGTGTPGGSDPGSGGSGKTAFDRHGMWIWYVSRSEGGNLDRIVSRARRNGIGTVYIKSGDSNDTWSQFNRPLVARLHRGGLDVCAWQFVYGNHPLGEAKVGAASVRRGADCLVIDAEASYEGRYASADRYVRALRARIGRAFPVSLAGFPYVDYHPSFPYSVFLGPGGAQYNQPQMYWDAIGTSVRTVFEHTYFYNRVFGRPIYPLGQTYGGVGPVQLKRFRRFAVNYGDGPPSWWDWQETSARQWDALGSAVPGPIAGYRKVTGNPTLSRGSRGDLVVWAQQHLAAAGSRRLPITGIFGRRTYAAVRSFQSARGLPASGVIGQRTWRRLLRVRPVRVRWGVRPKNRVARLAGASASTASPREPLSATLPARAYEIDPGPRP